LETRNTHTKRKDVWYFSPLVVVVLGFISLSLANAVPNGDSPLAWFFWDGGLVLIVMGILGGIITLGLYLWRTRAANVQRQSTQDSDQSK
jgi:hypothetical protein